MSYQVQGGIFGPGGHGNGIFQTSVLGLGETEVGPRGEYSEHTLSTQVMANAILPHLGKPKIGEDGKLGDKTCQAISDIIASGKYSGWTVPEPCLKGGAAETYTAEPEKSSNLTMPSFAFPSLDASDARTKLAMIAGGVLLALGGYYFWSTRK